MLIVYHIFLQADLQDEGTLENKEKGNFSSTVWKFKKQNNQADFFYIEDDSTKKVLQATSGNKVKLAKKVTLPGSGQLWKKGNPNIEKYYTLKNSDFSRFLTAKDTEEFEIKSKCPTVTRLGLWHLKYHS